MSVSQSRSGGHPGADGYYDPETGIITIKAGKMEAYLVLHELVHALRYRKKWHTDTDSHRLEEIIAVKTAYKIGSKAGMQMKVSKWQIPALINKTLRVNGMKPRPLTEAEKATIEKEVDRTFDLFVSILKDKGHELKEIDWVRTIILLLL